MRHARSSITARPGPALRGWLFTLLAMFAPLALAPAATAQNEFFMVIQGRVQSANGVTVANGDRVIAVIGSQSVSAQVDSVGDFSNLTIVRNTNDATPITMRFRKGGTTYQLVDNATDGQPLTFPYEGFNNPLAAAFGATRITAYIGAPVSGDGGNGGGNGNGDGDDDDDRDRADVDGDGEITRADARAVLRYIVGVREQDDASRLDVNRDGLISTDDVVPILRRVGEAAIVPPGDGDEEESTG